MADPPHDSSRRRSDPVDEAFEAVRAQAAGKNRDEIRQLLKDELTARGVDLPEGLIWSAADVLAHPHGLSSKVRMLRFGWRMLASIASESDALSDLFEGRNAGQGAISDPAARMSGWVEVILDDHGKAVLRSRRKRLGLTEAARDQVAVRLEHSGILGDLIANRGEPLFEWPPRTATKVLSPSAQRGLDVVSRDRPADVRESRLPVPDCHARLLRRKMPAIAPRTAPTAPPGACPSTG